VRVAFWPGIAGEEIATRLHAIAGIELTIVQDPAQLAAAAPQIEALVIGGHFFSRHAADALRGHAKRLRFIQTWTAGYEGLQQHGVAPGVIVANAGEAWSPGVAEHALALCLALVKCLPHAVANQPRHAWDRTQAPRMGTLEGATAVIAGYGSIGREFARRAKAFGTRIIGLRRNPQPDGLADEVRAVSELNRSLGEADVVLVSAPYSKATEHMIGAAQFAACRKGAILINVARGGLVDYAALAMALRSGQLGGCGTDVTDPEPLPAEDAFWDCPNLVITPHVAGACGPVGRRRLADHVGANVERFVAGRTPQYLVTL